MFNDAEILNVDDNSLYSLHLKTQLEGKGYSKVEITHKVKGVLSCLENKNYHLVICPNDLPEMTSDELILRVRFGVARAQPCFLFLADSLDFEPMIFNHVSCYSKCPIDIDSFEKAIRNLLLGKISGVGTFN